MDHCDWRLPNNAELQTILLEPFPCGTNPCIDPIFGPIGLGTGKYWSSTTFGVGSVNQWIVGFGTGTLGFVDFEQKWESAYVRAVRGGL